MGDKGCFHVCIFFLIYHSCDSKQFFLLLIPFYQLFETNNPTPETPQRRSKHTSTCSLLMTFLYRNSSHCCQKRHLKSLPLAWPEMLVNPSLGVSRISIKVHVVYNSTGCSRVLSLDAVYQHCAGRT